MGAAIDRLLILSANIRRSARQTRRLRQGSDTLEKSFSSLLRATWYPNARESLCSQLGASIHARGIWLQHTQEHTKKPSCRRKEREEPVANDESGPKEHVQAQDIEPYVCISEDCLEPLQYFTNSKDWMSHMQTRHSMNWSERIHTERWHCDLTHDAPNEELQEFDNKVDFFNHFNTCHGVKLTQAQLLGRIRRNRRLATRDPFVCPLCGCVPDFIKDCLYSEPYLPLWGHIAQHLESVASLSLSYVEDGRESSRRPATKTTQEHVSIF